MTKKYNSPMLQVVSIKKNDIVTGSPVLTNNAWSSSDEILAPGRDRNFNSWYEGD